MYIVEERHIIRKFASNLFKAMIQPSTNLISQNLPNWSMSKVENSWKDLLISVAEISNFSKRSSINNQKLLCATKVARKNKNFLV